MKKEQPDYYAVLGVERDASLRAIKQAYRDLVRRYHPDAAGDSAEARRRFELLQEAYDVLADPDKRARYDASLPPRKYPLVELDAATLWREVTDLIFERSDSFSVLLQTMQVAVPITIEGDLLVVGVAGKDQYLAGHLETPAHRHRIREALREVSGREMDYRAIEGTTAEDWEFVKRAESRRAAPATPVPGARAAPGPAPGAVAGPAEERRVETAPLSAWDLLGRKIQNAWQSTANRHHPLVRAEFVLTCVNWIVEAAKQATEEGEPPDEVQREVGKGVERVANLLDIPPTIVALELARGRQRRRPS